MHISAEEDEEREQLDYKVGFFVVSVFRSRVDEIFIQRRHFVSARRKP